MKLVLRLPAVPFMALPGFEWASSTLPLTPSYNYYNSDRKIGIITIYMTDDVIAAIQSIYLMNHSLDIRLSEHDRRAMNVWVDKYISAFWFPVMVKERISKYIDDDAETIYVYSNYNVLHYRFEDRRIESIVSHATALETVDSLLLEIVNLYPVVSSLQIDLIPYDDTRYPHTIWSKRTVQVI